MLDSSNVLCTGPFGAFADFEFNRIAFAQVFDVGILKCGVVEEQFSIVARDKSEALVADELLNGSGSQDGLLMCWSCWDPVVSARISSDALLTVGQVF